MMRMGIRGDVVSPGVVDGHFQLVILPPRGVAATAVIDVGDMDLIGAVSRCGNGPAIGDGHERAAIERVLQGDATGRQVVVQIKGFALFQFHGDHVFVVGVSRGDRAQIAADQ